MAGKLNIYNLGAKGNNVVKDSTQLEDGEFRKSQNLFVDQNAGDGSVRKRNGLSKLNSAAAGAGADVRGLINLPYPALKVTTIYAGIQRVGNDITKPTEIWRKSTDGTTWASESLAPTRAAYNSDSFVSSEGFVRQAMVHFKGKLFYAGDDYTKQTNDPPLHVWDGEVDSVVGYIPPNPTTGLVSLQANAMCIHRGQIALTAFDSGVLGRVFLLDPVTGAMEQVGLSTFGGKCPYAIVSWQGRLWVSVNAANFASSDIYYIRPGIDDDWTLDTSAPLVGGSLSLAVYKGKLYSGHTVTGPGQFPTVKVRDTLGTWSTSLTSAFAAGLGNNYFASLVVFNGFLFCLETNTGRGAGDFNAIYKFDNASWTSPWSLNDAAGGRTQAQIGMGVVAGDGKLYFVAAAEWQPLGVPATVAAEDGIVVRSTNGIAFTEVDTFTNLGGQIGFTKV